MTREQTLRAPQSHQRMTVEVVVNGELRSITLNPYVWNAFLEISEREGMSPDDLCALVESKMPNHKEQRSKQNQSSERVVSMTEQKTGPEANGTGLLTLTSAIRIFTLAYFHRLAHGKALAHDTGTTNVARQAGEISAAKSEPLATFGTK